MTKEDFLEQIRAKTIGEIENIFKLYSREISELENSIGKSKYDIIKFEVLNTINDLVNKKDIDQLNLFIKNPIVKEVGKVLGNENYIQYAIYERLMSIDNEKYKEYIITAINELQLIGDIKADLLINNKLLAYEEKIGILNNNVNLLKEVIYRIQFIGLTPDELTELVLSTKDVDFIKKCIKCNRIFQVNKVDLIIGLNDEKYIRQFIEDKNLKGINKTCLLQKFNNIDYIKKCIENKEIHGINRVQLLICLNDKDYIIKCVEKRYRKRYRSI